MVRRVAAKRKVMQRRLLFTAASLTLQRIARGFLARQLRRRLERRRQKAATLLQSKVRMLLSRQRYRASVTAIVSTQRYVRQRTVTRRLKRLAVAAKALWQYGKTRGLFFFNLASWRPT